MALPELPMFKSAPRLGDVLAPDRNSFGVIRLAMAIAVLVSHSYWFTTGSKIADPLVRWTGHSIGEHAVQVFFFLSGILVAQSLLRSRSVLNFAVARALRIFPALIVCVLLTALVLGPMFTHGGLLHYFTDKQLPVYIVKTLMLITGSAPLPHLFQDQPLPDMVNVSLWTLKYEVLCYAGLGFIGAVGLMNERLRPFTTALLAILVLTVFIGRPKPLDTYTFADNLRYFALYFYAGVVAYLIRDHLRIAGIVLIPLALAFAALIGTRFGELACCLFLGYATLWVATFTFGPLRAFTNANDYSYGVYIFAGPIQQLVISLLPDYGATAVSLHALSIALPLAVFSWELIERPAIAMRKPILAWIDRVITPRIPGFAPPPPVPIPVFAEITPARMTLATRSARRAVTYGSGIIPWPKRRATIVQRG
jgi:peptidoglycan/LPS O-acetylase OafA/YrhL